MNTEKVMETITIEGAVFEIVDKPRTLYAGYHTTASDVDAMPNPGETHARYNKDKENIADPALPNCLCCLSIGFSNPVYTGKRPLEYMHGKETSNPNQPGGIYVFDSTPSLYIRLWDSDEALELMKKITSGEKCGVSMSHYFPLITQVFLTEQYGYERNNSTTNHGMEYYYEDGRKCVYLPVKKANPRLKLQANNLGNNQANESNARKDERDKSAGRAHLASILYMSQLQNPVDKRFNRLPHLGNHNRKQDVGIVEVVLPLC